MMRAENTDETRTVHFTFDPAFQAYLAWLGDREFDGGEYATFAAGYRARVDEQRPKRRRTSGRGQEA